MNKRYICRILVLFIFILAIITMITPNRLFASSITDMDGVTESSSLTVASGSIETPTQEAFSQLAENWWVLCCQQGTTLKDEEWVIYELYMNVITNPAESYILSTLYDTNSGEYSDEGQEAWWNTYTGHVLLGGGSGSNNLLWRNAANFQNYICDALEITDTYQTQYFYSLYSSYYTTYTIDGLTVIAPNLDAEDEDGNPIYMKVVMNDDIDEDGLTYQDNGESDDSTDSDDGDIDDKVTVSFDATNNKYIIGPYQLEYLERYGEVEEGTDESEAEIFAAITDAALTTNLGEMEYGEDWWFEYVDEDGESVVTGYPSDGKTFYIALKYKDGMTQIQNLEFEYKYLNAGGKVNVYTGTTYTCEGCDETFPEPRSTHVDADGEEYPVTASERQAVAAEQYGIKWYTYRIFDFIENITFSSIKITKTNIADEEIFNTDEQLDVDGVFFFTIYIDYGDGEEEFETLTIETVNGYGKASSSLIYWLEDEAPTYRVVEQDTTGFTAETEEWTGTLSERRSSGVRGSKYSRAV